MKTPRNLTGLFLGAGASYEIGMPLVDGLTKEILGWLTPEKLRSLNLTWRSQSGGYSDRIIDDFISVLQRSDQHYESLLGYLETQFMRSTPQSQEYYGMYSWLVDLVYRLLYLRHINNSDFIHRNLAYYDGLSVFADNNRPLWIFSLNHDVIIECICIRKDIPLNSGFTNEVVYLPRRDMQGKVIGQLKAEVLPGHHLDSSAMPFFSHGVSGVNLLRLHGALDIFTFRDGKDLLRILPLNDGTDGPLQALRATNEELVYRPDVPIRATNEIAYADHAGELQFLRRSLLAGAFKFNSRHSQVLPPRLLQHFRSYINNIHTLVCIGYAFADDHINRIIREWLEFSDTRQLEIIAPGIESVPQPFLHIAPQIKLRSSSATDYLDEYAGIVRSKDEVNHKKLVSWIRQNRESAIPKLLKFSRQHLAEKLVEKFKQFPACAGSIAEDSLHVPLEKLIQKEIKQVFTTEVIIDEFIKAQDEAL